jgi:hypothetical protein
MNRSANPKTLRAAARAGKRFGISNRNTLFTQMDSGCIDRTGYVQSVIEENVANRTCDHPASELRQLRPGEVFLANLNQVHARGGGCSGYCDQHASLLDRCSGKLQAIGDVADKR